MFRFAFALSLSVLLCAVPVLSAEKKSEAVPARPAKAVDRCTPVFIELNGTDSLGARLAMRMKETFNSGSLFTLTDRDEPKLILRLSTAPEFPSRPSVGSAYAAVWIFSQSKETLGSYLVQETGTFSADNLEDLVTKLAERTDGLATMYGYLLPKREAGSR
ncbi:MAG: hypothetical protein PUB69_03315 [Desulfovibrionaceae bacterium]|nr:hypothetical protein [Desulfovibrionaceae bacterium]